jgi:hypothetical protein
MAHVILRRYFTLGTYTYLLKVCNSCNSRNSYFTSGTYTYSLKACNCCSSMQQLQQLLYLGRAPTHLKACNSCNSMQQLLYLGHLHLLI